MQRDQPVLHIGPRAHLLCAANKDADLPLPDFIPADALSRYRSEIARVASRLSLEDEDCVTISVALQDLETFEKYKTVLPYYRNVVSEGVIVYAA